MRQRGISWEQIVLLARWLDTEPVVPDGKWFKRLAGFTICGEGELIKTFLEINSRLRKTNHQQIAEICTKSAPRFLWDGAFLQLSNSQVESLFADTRSAAFHLYQVH